MGHVAVSVVRGRRRRRRRRDGRGRRRLELDVLGAQLHVRLVENVAARSRFAKHLLQILYALILALAVGSLGGAVLGPPALCEVRAMSVLGPSLTLSDFSTPSAPSPSYECVLYEAQEAWSVLNGDLLPWL